MTKNRDRIVKLNQAFIRFKNDGNDKDFNLIYTNMRFILKDKFNNNTLFSNRDFIHEFDDVFQLTMIKVYDKKDKFNLEKGSILSFVFSIFKNTLIDEQRKIKMQLLDIDNFN